MKFSRGLLVLALCVAACAPMESADEIPQEIPQQETASSFEMLPAYELPWEKKKPGKVDSYDDYRAMHPQWYNATEWPTGNFNYRHMVEWEPMQELMITYSDGIENSSGAAQSLSEIISNTVLESNTNTRVIYQSQNSKNDLVDRLLNNGMTNAQIDEKVNWQSYDNDTIWHIDYGPTPLVRDDGAVAFVDFDYYHQRIYDDAISTKLGFDLDITTFRMPVGFEGGTFQGDGEGTCYTGQRALDNAGLTQGEIHDYLEKYLGCSMQTIVLQDISNDGTGHIDMFFKLTSKNHALVGAYGTYVQDPENEENMDDNEALLEATVVAGGGTVAVDRMQFPSADGSTPRTYLNSTIVNGINLWPVYTGSSNMASQAAALQVWQQVMPDHEHIPIYSNQLASWSGTIHCVSRTIPEGAYSPWIAGGSCEGGSCNGPALGYSGACNGEIPCEGPEWVSNSCDGIAYEGCCDGSSLKYCEGGTLQTLNCNSCGWNNSAGYYNCGESGADPSGTYPYACPAQCVPDCVGKTCGFDGCGGLCGTCSVGEECDGGQCLEPCVSNCTDKECGSDGCGGNCGSCGTGESCSDASICVSACGSVTYQGCCDGTLLQYCSNNAAQTVNCTNSCGWDASNGYYDCNESGADPSGEYPLACSGGCAGVFGDINLSGSTNVVDIQCLIVAVLNEAVGQPLPACVVIDPSEVDLNCDGNLDVTDVIFNIQSTLGVPMDIAVDANGNGCPDACE
jgi:agmatine/peptidylarginine deiminase